MGTFSRWVGGKKGTGFDETPSAKSDWNIKDELLEDIAAKLRSVQVAIAYCKAFKHLPDGDNPLMIALPMMETMYEVVRPPLKYYFTDIQKEIDWHFATGRDFQKEIAKMHMSEGIPMVELVTDFIEIIERTYRLLCEAIYAMGIGIVMERPMSQKQKMERVLLDI